MDRLRRLVPCAAVLARVLPSPQGILWRAMLGRKRDRAGRPLQEQFRNLVAENSVAATTIRDLTRGVRDVAPGALPQLPRSSARTDSNAQRNFARAFLRGSVWPRVYWARVRCLHPRTDSVRYEWIAFGLPHEYLCRLSRRSAVNVLGDRRGLDPVTERHMRSAETQAGVRLLPLGLWGDAAPTQWDRNESIETLSLNLPGQAGDYKQLRLPMVAFAKKHTCAHTWEDICSVLAWSFQILATGIAPVCRHDGSPWLRSDSWRQRGHPDRASAPAVPIRAALCEVRADWVFHTAVFRLPAHNRVAGNCWLCTHTPAEVHGNRNTWGEPPSNRRSLEGTKLSNLSLEGTELSNLSLGCIEVAGGR